MQEESDTSLRYSVGADINTLREAYQATVNGLDFYFEQTRQAYDDRRNIWPNKSADLRKHGPDPFPWEGASDTEALVVSEKIQTFTALLVGALKRANIRAFPSEVGDLRQAKVTSAFLKWMRDNYIRDFYPQAERAANYWLEKGIMISHVGWERQRHSFLRTITLQEIAESSPELAEMIMSKEAEADIATHLQQTFAGMARGRARRIVTALRNKGVAEIPYAQEVINRPTVEACAPDGEVLFPSWCIDPERAPYCFWRTFMTAQELEQKAATAGWDREWVTYMIDHMRGVETSQIESQYSTRRANPMGRYNDTQADLVEVIYAFRRLIDKEDGAEGIYLTVFNPDAGPDGESVPEYAMHELQSGMAEYPFVITRLCEDQKRMYDLQTFCDMFRGTQAQVKCERDGRIDNASMATLPPIMHPPGRRPTQYGPGRMIPERREGEIRFGPVPPPAQQSMEVEQTLLQQADRVVGLDPEDPDGVAKKQYYIDKYLQHHSKVLRMAYKAWQRYGPDQLKFRVTGYAEEQAMQKEMFDMDLDVTVSYDVQNNDPENVEKRLGQFSQLAMMDRYGKINQEALIEIMGGAIDPVLADAVMQSKEQSTQGVLEDVTDRLAKAYAGIDTGAGQGGAQVAMQAIQKYIQEPDVAERLQADEAFAGRIQNIYQQYEFQIQQAQNAEIGKIGGTPATFQGVQ